MVRIGASLRSFRELNRKRNNRDAFCGGRVAALIGPLNGLHRVHQGSAEDVDLSPILAYAVNGMGSRP